MKYGKYTGHQKTGNWLTFQYAYEGVLKITVTVTEELHPNWKLY
jgi:hypothetical protein